MQSSKGWIGLALSLCLLVGGWPAEASEVVKLARLVVSGKRAANEAPRTPSTPQEPRNPANAQAQGGGGSDEAGNAPAPSRSVS
ncbi:hypothetical protein [Roseateles sp. BYS96W]|uniref:DUF4148 domain-containing protein n=1 Tax=Pelomonas nitida TaxID=3299027 RepID=A0ABW7G5G6_9BURK